MKKKKSLRTKKIAFFLIFFIILPIVIVYPVMRFFYLPKNYPTGEEYVFLDTYIEIGAFNGTDYTLSDIDKVDLNDNISCYRIREDYIDDYLEFYLKFNNEEDFNNAIYISNRTEYKKVSQTILDKKSRFNLGFSELESLAEIYNIEPVFAAIYPSRTRDGYATTEITFPSKENNYLPRDKEMLFIFRNLYFINSPNLDVNASIEFYFPSEWIVVSCNAEEDNVSVLDKGMNAIFTKTVINEVNKYASYFIILKRDISKISLDNTKIGIIIGIFIAVMSMMVNLGIIVYKRYFGQ